MLHIFLLLVFDTREDQNTEDAQSGNNDERDSSPAPSLTTEDDRLCPPFSSKSEAVGVGDGATGCAQKTGDGNLIGSSTDGQGVVASAMDRATLLGEHANVLLVSEKSLSTRCDLITWHSARTREGGGSIPRRRSIYKYVSLDVVISSFVRL